MPAGMQGARVPAPSDPVMLPLVVRPGPVPVVRVPWWLLLPWGLVKWAGLGLLVAVRYWRLTVPAAVLLISWLLGGWWAPLLLVVVVAAAAGAWAVVDRGSFRRFGWWPVLGRWRRWRYSRRWWAAMSTAGLVVSFEAHTLMPQLRRLVCRGTVDILTVRPVSGQLLEDFTGASERLAAFLGALDVRVRPGRSGLVTLTVIRRDPLTAVVAPLPVVACPDFRALPLGRTEAGAVYELRLAGSHVLVAGATGAGKASVIWSVVRALAGGVRAGLVELWGVDPKGGMELGLGAALFARLACDDFEAMAELVEEAAEQTRARAALLRGTGRQFEPSPGDPLLVLVVDELATLTAYADRKIKDRVKNALGLVLSQGRAVGVHVVAALQDPRKEILPFRDLFPTRVALRVAEPTHVDMVLGDGARDRGAYADRIPVSLPGVGYVVLDGDPAPLRVRFSYLADSDVRELAATYGRPSLRVIDGELSEEVAA